MYVANDDFDTLGTINSAGAGDDAVTSASITVPMGAYTVTAGVADSDTGESASGASVAAAVGGGTLTVGYSVQSLIAASGDDLAVAGDSTVMGASYAMSLDADTSVTVGLQNAKDADDDSTSQFDASISRSLGGGASVFLDIRSLSGDATQDGSAIAVGSSYHSNNLEYLIIKKGALFFGLVLKIQIQ